MSYMSLGATLSMGILAFLSTAWLWQDTLVPSPRAGERGQRRLEALDKISLFRRFEIVIRVLAGQLEKLPLKDLKAQIDNKLIGAGRPLGMDSNDFLALSAIAAAVSAVIGAVACAAMGKGLGAGIIVGAIIGGALPFFKTDEMINKRRLAVNRGLPYAIDLAALSLEAGLDFQGSLMQVIARLKKDDSLRFEFEHLLSKISLGWSRRDALKTFAERMPIAQVRSFVNSVIQAEERGTPLASVLSTQADVMRTKRSQAAEQMAARAAVLIIGPLMLIFAEVFIILLGPFAIKFIRGQIF